MEGQKGWDENGEGVIYLGYDFLVSISLSKNYNERRKAGVGSMCDISSTRNAAGSCNTRP